MDVTKHDSANSFARIFKSKNIIFTIIAVAIIALISVFYFYPDDVVGNVLRQHDTLQGAAIGHEGEVFTQKTGEVSRWTNSLFSGMPTFQISPSYESSKLLSWVNSVYGLGLPSPANLMFMMMIGFFILLMACGMSWYIALIGAIGWGFSSYFMILIGAGHIWKFVTLAYIPPTIAGIVLCYRGKYLIGGALTALFATMQIASNHVQMSYYFIFVIVALAIGYLIEAIKGKDMKRWGIATGVLAVAATLAVAANSPNLYNTYKYSKESMRGGHSEIPAEGKADNATKSGLDKDYITAWSYGKAETFSLIIPNVNGGATIKPEKGDNKFLTLADTEKAVELHNNGKISDQDFQYLQQFPQYFGDQPMTNGPVYIGALIFVLFIIGCIIIKGPVKWAILAVTILSIFLSWGHNFMGLTDIFIDYFPMYNKFRTVSSILVVAEFTMPLLAMMALQKILTEKDFLKNNIKTVFGSFGVCAALCLIIYLYPNFFDVYSASEKEQFIQSGIAQQVPTLFAAIDAVRSAMISADAMRSLLIIILGAGVLFVFMMGKIKASVTAALVCVVVLLDLYTVNKRYLNTDSFTTANIEEQKFEARPVDKVILQDTSMNYRVVDQQHFGDAMPSYFHKTIGGYHAAKLTRYQDIIDHQLSKNNQEVFNMLNTKYIIASDTTAYPNTDALGNAWFVDTLSYVGSPAEEMKALDTFHAASQAVADKKFEPVLGSKITPKASCDTIFETSYAPNELTYHATSRNGGLAVFSEIYFPWGWKATIDGKDVEIGRVNYILRALNVPAGSHTIHFKFDPESVSTTETIAYIAITLIYLAFAAALAIGVLRATQGKKEDKDKQKK